MAPCQVGKVKPRVPESAGKFDPRGVERHPASPVGLLGEPPASVLPHPGVCKMVSGQCSKYQSKGWTKVWL